MDVRVRDILTQQPLVVDAGARVSDVARQIAAAGTDAAVVCVRGQPVGIITEHDLVHRVMATGLSPERSRAEQVMSSPVRTIPAGAPAAEAARIMTLNRLRHIPVLEGGRMTGLVTDKDVIALSPMLFEAVRDGPADRGRPEGPDSGVCEGCQTLSADLTESDGALLCEECAETARAGTEPIPE